MMMIDGPAPGDRAARLAALRERRAAAGGATPSPLGPATTAPAATPRVRRHHAAAGARIMAGSLSAATALALMGAMAQETTGTAKVPTPASATRTTATVVVIRRSGITAPAVAPPVTPTVTPMVTPTAVAPVATSRGS